MAGWNSTTSFSLYELWQCDPKNNTSCDVSSFDKSMGEKMLRLNALMVTSAILAGIIVGIGAYVQHYRHRSVTRFIYLGAISLFIPIISYVMSISAEPSAYIMQSAPGESSLAAKCDPDYHSTFVVIWAFLVQIIIINTSVVVALDDREGQSNMGPPLELLVHGVWTLYLGILYGISFKDVISSEFVPFALVCAKIMFKYYAFQKARRSFSLGRNPLLISGYMQQLQQQEVSLHEDLHVGEDACPPPLLVTGEERRLVEKKPCGYMFKDGSKTTSSINRRSLVTIDRVWAYEDTMLPTSRSRLKDLCLSFALFKLLRCRFMRFKITTVHSNRTLNLFWSLLLKDGEHARVVGVIAHELSFINDYYYSSLPISYSKCWLPILSIVISFLSIGFCILIMVLSLIRIIFSIEPQIECYIMCIGGSMVCTPSGDLREYGNLNFDLVPMVLLAVLVMIAEVRDMASYICSNWTKVALMCRLVNRASSHSHPSFCMQKWVIGFLLQCRCKLLNHWDGNMGQCSVLVICPRTFLKHLLQLPDQKRKVKVQEPVKVCIINALRSIRNGRQLSKGTSSLHGIQDGDSFVWACNGEGTTDTILVWHIATSILELKHPYHHDQEDSSPPISYSDHMITATHLSRYCVYLVKRCPELLPDDKEWSKSLYKDVKKDAERALADHTSARSSALEEYGKLVELLSVNSKHDVLKNGVKLGKQLVETIDGEETTWKLLAEFWSEMILYVSPSDNFQGHKEAIARGGELITLLWVLLFHAGIVTRPGEEDGAASTSAGAV